MNDITPNDITVNGIVAIAFGSIGFVIRKVWDTWSSRRENLRQLRIRERINFLEKALKNFYWPLYIMLCKDMIVWRKNELLINNVDVKSILKCTKTIKLIESSIIIPNHIKILEILRSFTHLAQPDAEFKEQILLYIKHASLYICIRKSGDKKSTPKDFGAPFPIEFIKYIENNTNKFQSEYNNLLGIKYDKNGFINKKTADLLGMEFIPNKEKSSWNPFKHCRKKEPDIEKGIPLSLITENTDNTENNNYFNSKSLYPF